MKKLIDAKMTAVDAAEFLGITVQGVHKRLKESKLESLKSQNRVYFGHNTAGKIFNLKFKKKVISFQIVKGGVGKTSLSHAFAIRASLYGARVLCIDLDQQGNLTRAFNLNADETPIMVDLLSDNIPVEDCIVNIGEGIDLLPSRIENAVLDNFIMLNKYPLDRLYKNIIDKVKMNYDLIVFDCPPALGQSVAAASLASDLVLAAVTPEQFSLNALHITSEELKKLNETFDKHIVLKIVLNKLDTRNAFSSEALSYILNNESVKGALCNSFIRICQEFPNTIYAKTNIFDSLKNNSAKEDVDLLTRELLEIDQAQTLRKVSHKMPSIPNLQIKKSKKFEKKEFRPWDKNFVLEKKEEHLSPLDDLDNKRDFSPLNNLEDLDLDLDIDTLRKLKSPLFGSQKIVLEYLLTEVDFTDKENVYFKPVIYAEVAGRLNIPTNTLKASLSKFKKREIVQLNEFKPGRGGYSIYVMNKNIYRFFSELKS